MTLSRGEKDERANGNEQSKMASADTNKKDGGFRAIDAIW
jgi:hypothetical protein